MFYFNFTLFLIYTLFTFWFSVSSFKEKATRAGVMGLILGVVMLLIIAGYGWLQDAGLLSGSLAKSIQLICGVILALFTILMFLPIGRNPKALEGTRGMKEGEPEKLNQKDTAFNLSHVGKYGAELGRKRWAMVKLDPYGGIFQNLCMGLRHQVEGEMNPQKKSGFSTAEITNKIKKEARYLGADMVGIATVRDDFVYQEAFSYEDSKIDVGPAITTPIEMKHRYVIVLAKEMDYDKIQTTLTERNEESAGEINKTYYDLAQMAVALAAYIRQLGYSARAHHLRNEQIFMVPHAIDAGLGEQGRFNYLITPRYGPRVRLAAVTTELELIEDQPIDIGVQDFCNICSLCEINCPVNAIESEKEVIRGYRKWPQEQRKCLEFWFKGVKTGGCTLCLKICPWNKPLTFVHRVSFFLAARSFLARRLLYWMAIIFYGERIQWKMSNLSEKPELQSEGTPTK